MVVLDERTKKKMRINKRIRERGGDMLEGVDFQSNISYRN